MQKPAGTGEVKVSTTGSEREELMWKHRQTCQAQRGVNIPAAGRFHGRRGWGQAACWGSSGLAGLDQVAWDLPRHPTAAQKTDTAVSLFLKKVSHGTTKKYYHLYLATQCAYSSPKHCSASPPYSLTPYGCPEQTVSSLLFFFFPQIVPHGSVLNIKTEKKSGHQKSRWT